MDNPLARRDAIELEQLADQTLITPKMCIRDSIMSVLEPGDLFGAAALFNDRADYATTLTARAPCRVLLLPQALVEELMGRFPEVGRNYVAYLSGRICFLSGKIDALTAGSACLLYTS